MKRAFFTLSYTFGQQLHTKLQNIVNIVSISQVNITPGYEDEIFTRINILLILVCNFTWCCNRLKYKSHTY